jgi:glycosyltransferase involved in cell wall biosynthesis
MENVVRALSETLSRKSTVEVLTTDCGAKGVPRRESAGSLRVRRARAVEVAHTPIAPGLLLRLLRLPRKAIVHVHVAQALVPEMVWLAAAIRRRPFVAHFHLDVEPSGRFGPLFAGYKRLVLGRTLRAAAKVIVLSAAQADFVATAYGVRRAKVAVLPNGVDEEFVLPPSRPDPGDRPVRLLYVGRLTPQKNIRRLLEAFGRMTRPASLTLVGDGEDRAMAERLAGRLGLTEVRFAGAQRGPALVEWYRWADVFVLASDREGMPLVLLEAMAAGLPIVATDVAGTRELVGDVGLLTGCDAAALAAGLDRIAGEPELRASLAAASHRLGRARTWPSLLPRIEAVYREVC